MEQAQNNTQIAEPRYVKVIKILALYVFPFIIVSLIIAILVIPSSKP